MRIRVTSLLLALCVSGLVCLPAASAPLVEAPPPEHRHLTMIRVPAPWWAPRFLIERRMQASVPRYQAAAGLERKYYTLGAKASTLGGIYLWQDRAAADAFFDSAWHQDIEARYGVPAEIWRFQVPLQVRDRASEAGLVSSDRIRVASIVRVPSGDVSEAALEAGFFESRARFESVPGLIQKDFAIAEDGRIGGVYLWESASAARDFHDAVWRQRARTRWGTEPEVTLFEVPLQLDNREP